jgi:hypothetical protein
VEAGGDDVLGEVFLSLPDMKSLAQAALSYKRWLHVASDPTVRPSAHGSTKYK